MPLTLRRAALSLASLAALSIAAGQLMHARAQSLPTATQTLTISAFAGVTGTYTGLLGGRNAAVTAGADLSFLPFHRFYPSIEVRGTEPVIDGGVNTEKNILAGLKVSRHFGRLHPYANLLAGRGSIAYLGQGAQVPNQPIFYTLSHSTVYSPGVGFDFEIASQWSIKLDGQYQRYNTPVTTSGHLYAESGTAALVYRFDFNKHHHMTAR